MPAATAFSISSRTSGFRARSANVPAGRPELGPLRQRIRVEDDQGGEVLAPVTDGDHVRNQVGLAFDGGLDRVGDMFLPAEVMMSSFLRPVTRRQPSASSCPRSPVCSQPSASIASAVASGRICGSRGDVRSADQDFAVRCDPDGDLRVKGLAHRTGLELGQ